MVLVLPVCRLPGRHDRGHGHGGDGARAGRLQAQDWGPGHQRNRGGGEVAAAEDTHRVPGLRSGSVYKLLSAKQTYIPESRSHLINLC